MNYALNTVSLSSDKQTRMRKVQSIVHEGCRKIVFFLCLMLVTLQPGRACPELIEGACGQVPVATEPNPAVVQEKYYGNDQGMPGEIVTLSVSLTNTGTNASQRLHRRNPVTGGSSEGGVPVNVHPLWLDNTAQGCLLGHGGRLFTRRACDYYIYALRRILI